MNETKRQQVEQRKSSGGSRQHVKPRLARGTQEIAPVAPVEPVAHERLIEDDIAEIVHDLKSPLSAIALEVAVLDGSMLHGEPALTSRSLGRIAQNVAYLDRLVLDLLDACALASGTLQPRREPVELRMLIAEAIDRMAVAPPRKIVLDAPHGLVLLLDPLRIERVIANLLDNALKYSPRSSEIIVRMSADTLGARVSIIDSGPGIAAHELTYIFDRFRRAETSRGKSGSGLGLYVAKRIIEAHGGTIGVESIVGAGTRFFFELPATDHA